MRTILAGVSALLAFATAASAQDYGLEPNYGVVRGIGYPDPYLFNLTAGGPLSAATPGGGCRGYITQAPDIRYQHRSGSLPLIISARSDADLTLIVNAPDGSWICDDDSGEGLNPSIRLDTPLSGAYDIWVGTYGPQTAPATLSISEQTGF